MKTLVSLLDWDPRTVVASGASSSLPTLQLDYLAVDVNVTSLRGDTPTIEFSVDRLGLDQIWYPAWSPDELTAAGKLSADIGTGASEDYFLTSAARLSYTLGGESIATTVDTGAASATQTLDSTEGILPGDVLHFATADADRTVLSVTDGTILVLTATITTTTGEDVTVTNTPAATFSASIQSRQENP